MVDKILAFQAWISTPPLVPSPADVNAKKKMFEPISVWVIGNAILLEKCAKVTAYTVNSEIFAKYYFDN